MNPIKQVPGRHRGQRAGVVVTGGIVALVLAVLGAGGAFAYFAASSGSADATAGSIAGVPVVSTAVVTPTGDVLYPGGTGGFTIMVEPTDHPVRITDIAQDLSRAVVVSHAGPNCQSSSVTLTAQHHLTLDVSTAAVTRTFANAVSMSSSASNDCQGASFEIPVVLTGRSR